VLFRNNEKNTRGAQEVDSFFSDAGAL